METDVEIEELDVTDAEARRRWYDVMADAAGADRPRALLDSRDGIEVTMTEPSAYVDRTWLQAVVDGEVVGVASVELPLEENTDVAWCEVDVLAQHRRQGIGRALSEAVVDRARDAGRTRIGAEVTHDVEVAGAGLAFAQAMGAVEKHREDHLLADLPVPAVPIDPAYEVVAWLGRCPDEHRAAYIAMRNQMNLDVPTGELDLEAAVLDDARLSASEERLAKAYGVHVVAARRRADGVFGGYSMLFASPGADRAWQDDTLVMPGHRGHRLGAAMKAANYAGLPPTVVQVDTYTAPTNVAMHHTNTALGFRVVEHMYEVEAVIA